MEENTVVVQEAVQEANCLWELSDKLTAANLAISLLMLLVTAVSVYYAFKAYNHQKERAKKDAACDLARDYADTILLEDQIILTVFAKTELNSFIKQVFPMDEIDSFSAQEMKKFIEKSAVSPAELKERMENIDPQIILDVMLQGTPSYQERALMQDIYSEVDAHTGKRVVKNGAKLRILFMTKMLCLANKLEWFSMKCRYGLADEELLYQSLHQTFLSMVWRLYYYISQRNFDINDKYYTNTIWLFKTWHDRLRENKNKAALEAKEAMETIREAQKKIENAGHEYTGKPLH